MTQIEMLELFQTEWCPASRRVRRRLTELGIDYVARQVPVAKEHRHILQRVAGTERCSGVTFRVGRRPFRQLDGAVDNGSE